VLRDALIYLSGSKTARKFAQTAPGARTMARRFAAGDNVQDGIAATRELNKAGMSVTLDYLGESVHNRAEARSAADIYIQMIEQISAEGLDANVSMKLTQMGQDIDTQFMHDNLQRVLEKAKAVDMFVRFDMESSAYTQKTLDFFRSLWSEGYRNIGVVIQSYLRRSHGDIEQLNVDKVRVRLCKGAYNEPASAAYQAKSEVDNNYVRLMQMLLENGNYPGIATHDPAMIRATREFAKARSIPSSAYEFQMLYGVRRDLQHQLVQDGYRMRVYVPFGEAWYPYLMRRMAERPSNLMFIVNAVARESPLRVFMGRDR
jgi:proline dehydrogenase